MVLSPLIREVKGTYFNSAKLAGNMILVVDRRVGLSWCSGVHCIVERGQKVELTFGP